MTDASTTRAKEFRVHPARLTEHDSLSAITGDYRCDVFVDGWRHSTFYGPTAEDAKERADRAIAALNERDLLLAVERATRAAIDDWLRVTPHEAVLRRWREVADTIEQAPPSPQDARRPRMTIPPSRLPATHGGAVSGPVAGRPRTRRKRCPACRRLFPWSLICSESGLCHQKNDQGCCRLPR